MQVQWVKFKGRWLMICTRNDIEDHVSDIFTDQDSLNHYLNVACKNEAALIALSANPDGYDSLNSLIDGQLQNISYLLKLGADPDAINFDEAFFLTRDAQSLCIDALRYNIPFLLKIGLEERFCIGSDATEDENDKTMVTLLMSRFVDLKIANLSVTIYEHLLRYSTKIGKDFFGGMMRLLVASTPRNKEDIGNRENAIRGLINVSPMIACLSVRNYAHAFKGNNSVESNYTIIRELLSHGADMYSGDQAFMRPYCDYHIKYLKNEDSVLVLLDKELESVAKAGQAAFTKGVLYYLARFSDEGFEPYAVAKKYSHILSESEAFNVLLSASSDKENA